MVDRSVTAFLKCGDLQQGFARVRCPDCHHEMFVAFSCKQRCTCPSCHQKRALLTAIHVAEEVCAPVPHRQVVLTIPKRLRVHTRFDRRLLGKLAHCGWNCIRSQVRRLLGREDVVPGMVAAIQSHGELLHWHPHLLPHGPSHVTTDRAMIQPSNTGYADLPFSIPNAFDLDPALTGIRTSNCDECGDRPHHPGRFGHYSN